MIPHDSMNTPAAQKIEKQSSPETHETQRARARVIGFLLFPLALLPFLALASYDWHDIAELAIPSNTPVHNLIGIAGARFAYNGYRLIGLAVWAIPAVMALAGAILASGRAFRPWRRALALTLLVFSGTALLELLNFAPSYAPLLHDRLNISDAGGALGYLVMKRGLASALSPFGASVLMVTMLVASLILLIGAHNIVRAMATVVDWASGGRARTPEEIEAAMRRREEREAAALQARLAREEARRQREEERRAAIEEKERLKAMREAEREAAKAAREAEALERERARALMDAPSARPAPVNVFAPEPQAAAAADDRRGGDPDGWLSRRRRPRARDAEPVQGAAPAKAAQPSAAERPSPAPAESEDYDAPQEPYVLPPVSLLSPIPKSTADHGDVAEMAQKLIDTLKVFDINATLAYTVEGPVVTQYALEPELGVRVERIAGLSGNLQMVLRAKSLRIQAPIPGENAVGIEVPNKVAASVSFREIVESKLWRDKAVIPKGGAQPKFQVPLLLGKDAAGHDLVVDLAKIPHLLVAGATGQGKSVCLNSIINGLLMCRTPNELRMIMVDPKRVEFTSYAKLPHLLVPVVNDTKKVVFSLKWAVTEMEKRLKLFSKAGCRNIIEYNTRKTITQPGLFGDEELLGDESIPKTIPYIVIIIDELADIMQTAGKEVEPVIARLLALARAVGIHLILATQRPDTKVITGTLKANIPGRIAFKTSQGNDSRTILDSVGAEDLIGKGDMLFKTPEGTLLRAQGSYISNEDIFAIVDFIGQHSKPQFDESLTKKLEKIKEADPEEALEEEAEGEDGEGGDEQPQSAPRMTAAQKDQQNDDVYNAALDVLRRTGRASVSHLQRRMGIGYNHAARLIDLLEERGIIGPAKGAGPREILVDLDAMMSTPEELAVKLGEEESPAEDGAEDGLNERKEADNEPWINS